MAGGKAGWATRLARWLASWQIILVLAVVAVTPFVLGYIGLARYVPHQPVSAGYGDSWDDILYYDLQLYTLSSAPAASRGPFPVWLGIARFLAPAGTLLAGFAALILLAKQFRQYTVEHPRDHAIVIGDDSIALTLARNLREGEGKHVVLVTTSDDTLARARLHDMVTVRGHPGDRATLRAAGVAWASELWACTCQGTVNAGIALRAGDEVHEPVKQPLVAYAMVRDAELSVALRAHHIGMGGDSWRGFFAVEDIAARRLLDKHPLALADGSPVHVVISGFGRFGQAVLREVAHRRQALPGSSGPVSVAIRRATMENVAKVIDAFPVIRLNCEITYNDDLELPVVGEPMVYVCLDSDDDALSEGLAMARPLVGQGGHVVVCMREYDPFAGVLAARSGLFDDVMGRLSMFGVIQEACVPADIRADFTEQLARSIHSAKVAMGSARGFTPATDPEMLPWESLPEDLRQLNFAQAADIGAKLEAIGAIVVPQSAAAPAFAFADQEIENLARLQHEWWMRERLDAGWRYGPYRDDQRRFHPELQSWDYLGEADKDKERDAVRTLSETLRDAGYQILRVPQNP